MHRCGGAYLCTLTGLALSRSTLSQILSHDLEEPGSPGSLSDPPPQSRGYRHIRSHTSFLMWVLEILNPEPRFIERQMRFHTEPSCQPSQDFLKLGGWHSNRYHSLSLLFFTITSTEILVTFILNGTCLIGPLREKSQAHKREIDAEGVMIPGITTKR